MMGGFIPSNLVEVIMIKRFVFWIMPFLAIVVLLLILSLPLSSTSAQTENPNPPDQPVKLIFIHHSTGENWLTDGYGDLGKDPGREQLFRQRYQLRLGSRCDRRPHRHPQLGGMVQFSQYADLYGCTLQRKWAKFELYPHSFRSGRRERDHHVQILLPQLGPGGQPG